MKRLLSLAVLLALPAMATEPPLVRMTCHFDSPEGPKELTLAIDTVKKTVDSTPPSPVKIEDSLYSWQAGSTTFSINRYTGKFLIGTTEQPELMTGSCAKSEQKL
jgi:hypothetical protein